MGISFGKGAVVERRRKVMGPGPSPRELPSIQKEEFIRVLREGGTLIRASQAAGLHFSVGGRWAAEDPDIAAVWNQIKDDRARVVETNKLAVISAVTDGAGISLACKKLGLSGWLITRWEQEDQTFAEELEAAKEHSTQILEHAMYARAVRSDTPAAMFLLKARRPKVYRENTLAVTGADGGPIQQVIEFTIPLSTYRPALTEGEIIDAED